MTRLSGPKGKHNERGRADKDERRKTKDNRTDLHRGRLRVQSLSEGVIRSGDAIRPKAS